MLFVYCLFPTTKTTTATPWLAPNPRAQHAAGHTLNSSCLCWWGNESVPSRCRNNAESVIPGIESQPHNWSSCITWDKVLWSFWTLGSLSVNGGLSCKVVLRIMLNIYIKCLPLGNVNKFVPDIIAFYTVMGTRDTLPHSVWGVAGSQISLRVWLKL